MHKAKKDITKLPKWVQQLIAEKDREIERLKGVKEIHELFTKYKDLNWFCIGPCDIDMTIYYFVPNHAKSICFLRKGDVLFVARKPDGKKEE